MLFIWLVIPLPFIYSNIRVSWWSSENDAGVIDIVSAHKRYKEMNGKSESEKDDGHISVSSYIFPYEKIASLPPKKITKCCTPLPKRLCLSIDVDSVDQE